MRGLIRPRLDIRPLRPPIAKDSIFKTMTSSEAHPYHLPDYSPWPLFASISLFGLTTGVVAYLHSYAYGWESLKYSFYLLIFCLINWWRDIVRESTYEGKHTRVVQRGLRIGMILFIASEVMFFFAFFWTFFHSSLSPAIQIGAVWPPRGIVVLDPWALPLFNTMILLLSGATVTWAHHCILGNMWEEVEAALFRTVGLGLLFTLVQYFEYRHAPFTIADSIYGSIFYMATGFHGLHVLIGTTFLIVCIYRNGQFHFTQTHHFGFEAAAWYWHFVDVVWLFLFVSIYWWGGK